MVTHLAGTHAAQEPLALPRLPRRNGLPIATVDVDGVLCAPVFGWNVGISERFIDPTARPRPARLVPRWLGEPLDYLRFNFRRPLPEAFVALGTLRQVRTVVVLTGRRSQPDRWLDRHRLLSLIDHVIVNETSLRSAHFKLQATRALDAAEHIDDDGRTVQLLAEGGEVRPYLRDWPRNRTARYDPKVTRVADILDFAQLLVRESEQAVEDPAS